MCLQCSKSQEIQDFILNSIQNPPKMQLFVVDERSEETTLYSGRNHPLLLFHKFYNVDTMVQKSSKIVVIVNL